MSDSSPDYNFEEPEAVRRTTAYMRRLLMESPYIYARILNPGGSVILSGTAADTERMNEYSSTIGSSSHLDLIDANDHLRKDFSVDERKALLTWALGMTPKQASYFLSAKGPVVRKRRQRAVEKLTDKMVKEDDGRT